MTASDNPFVIPKDGTYTINFSGGRSSAYMLRQIMNANNGIPKNCFVVFANTGKEMVQTLDFVHACENYWRVPIIWLEYRYDPTAKGGKKYPKNTYTVVDYATASRNGEPFAQLNKSRNYLPNVMQRICTLELKVNTIARYLRLEHDLLKKDVIRILGIRYDEPNRWSKAIYEECDVQYPMVYAKVDKRQVLDYWENNHFDLQLDNTSIQGNCDLCFLKGESKLKEQIKNNPNLTHWWIQQEWNISRTNQVREKAAFLRHMSYYDLYESVIQNKQPELNIEEMVDCYCGD